MTEIGYPCINRAYSGMTTGVTGILPNSIADSNGVINSWCIYVTGACSAKLKIFRDDGTNFIHIGESSLESLSAGANFYLPCSISVQAGDYIGIYMSGAAGIRNEISYNSSDTGEQGWYNKSGDVSTNSLKSTWNNVDTSNFPSRASIFASSIINKYVKTTGNDTLDGLSWANAWATVNKGMTDVQADATLHVGFGSYTGEPANNNLSPDAANVTVVYETATTGGGTGTATVEVN